MKTLFIFFLLLTNFFSYSQEQRFTCFYGEGGHPDLACLRMHQYSFSSETDANTAIRTIIRPLGLAPNFVLVPCLNINNCAAITLSDGIRYIVYDNDFMTTIAKSARTNWVYTSILAHEIGHHLQGHTTMGSTLEQARKMELEADRFSGFILQKLGATLDEAEAAMKQLPDPDNESLSDHPLRWRRLESIEAGYNDAIKGAQVSHADQPVITTSATTLVKHDIITSNSFPSLSESWNKGYRFRDAVYSENKWYVFMVKDGKPQSYRYRNYYPKTEIEALWQQNKYIDYLNYSDGNYHLIMSGNDIDFDEVYFTSSDFPKEKIQEYWDKDYVIRNIFKSGTKWTVVLDKAINGSWHQLWRSRDYFPEDIIKEYWNQDYVIRVLKFFDNKWYLVMDKDSKSSQTGQKWFSRKYFPLDEMIKYENEGYILQCADYDGDLWVIVMNN
ncbi:hypothetical protein EFY79_19775 [Hanamia caeni]|uniref:Uncharacterized protein n=1 Tax=Hanamia caeni TaxID=2294116 RepID=A0A3M9N6K5_9BACT|nr:hypothetical protein [Hanamia caeni]RNI32833.1 hypothetical protein EFY79_19775 [Hanamia caeni]